MSTVQTYLTIVFTYKEEMRQATSNFAEEDVRRELDDAGIGWPTTRKEVHVSYKIHPPLDPQLVERLTRLKSMGMISSFYVKDEIEHE